MTDRPHCLQRRACVAKTPGKHCPRCTNASPACRAAKSAAIKRKLSEDPAFRAQRLEQLAARRLDPASEARRVAGVRQAHADPAVKRRHHAGCVAATARRMADPAYRAELVRLGREYGVANLHLGQSRAARDKAGVAVRAVHLSWCPPEYWGLNQVMKRKAIPLEERKRIIAEEIDRTSPAAEGRRIVAQVRRESEAREAKRRAQAY